MLCSFGNIYVDDSGKTRVRVIMSERVYAKLRERFPNLDIKALTDDVRPVIPAPTTDSPEAWEAVYRQLVAYLEAYDELANPIRIFRHKKKGALLLPREGFS